MAEFHLSISSARSSYQELSAALREEPVIIAQMGDLLAKPLKDPVAEQASKTDLVASALYRPAEKTTEAVTRTWIFDPVITPENFGGVKRRTVSNPRNILKVTFTPKKKLKRKNLEFLAMSPTFKIRPNGSQPG